LAWCTVHRANLRTLTLTQVREQGLQASIEMQKREAALSLQLEARDTQLEAMQAHVQQAGVASLTLTLALTPTLTLTLTPIL
jgi:hypothetical protein